MVRPVSEMSDRVITKVLDKRVTNDGNDEYLVECQINDKTGQQWLTGEDLQNYEHLIHEFDHQRHHNGVTNHSMNGHPSSTDTEPKNGFDKGFRPYKILGAKSDDKNQLMFLVMFREDLTKADLIPNHVLHEKCPQLLIKFYERNILWKRS